MNTSVINIRNTIETIKKWLICSLLICSSFGLLYQVGSIYQFKQLKDENTSLMDANNIFYAIKKGWFITLLNILVFIIIFVNIKYIYILNYSRVFTYVLLLANFIILFELVLTNLYYAMYAVNDLKLIDIMKKSLVVANLNIGLSILVLFFAIVIISFISVSPLTAYLLVPFFIMCLQRIYVKLEKKYEQEQTN